MSSPSSVKIGGVIYAVKRIKKLNDEGTPLYGWFRQTMSEILLEQDMSKQQERAVLWHEILHGLLSHGGYSNHDEQMLDALAFGIMAALTDNPWLGKAP